MSCGIYCITNLINGKQYVGQSIHIHTRINQHFNYHGISHGSIIDKAILKYGKDNFQFKILEECPIEELNSKEIYYIKLYNTIAPNGYNVTTGGENGVVPDKCFQVSQYNLKGELVKTFTSIHCAMEETGIARNTISDQVRGLRTPAFDFFFRYGNIPYQEPPTRYIDTLKKSVYVYDKTTRQFLQSFDSTANSARWRGDISYSKNINSALNGKRNIAYDYIWSYIKWNIAPENYREENKKLYESNKK